MHKVCVNINVQLKQLIKISYHKDKLSIYMRYTYDLCKKYIY